MGKLIKGPFDLQYGLNTLADIEKVDFNYSVDTDDTTVVQGRKTRTYGAHQASVTVTFLQSDIASLAVALPQYHVANGGTLSSGETVTDPNGAMDFVPGGCDSGETKESLIISSCGDDGEYLRLLDAVSEIAGIDINEKRRTVDVQFTGQGDAATIQMFGKGAISVVS